MFLFALSFLQRELVLPCTTARNMIVSLMLYCDYEEGDCIFPTLTFTLFMIWHGFGCAAFNRLPVYSPQN